MNFKHLAKKDHRLSSLIDQANYWRKLERQVKLLLPKNLAEHFQVVCIENSTLIFYTENPMVASRLKMILPALLPNLSQLDARIQKSNVSVHPKSPQPQKEKQAFLSFTAQEALQQAAEQVSHHPDLAAALFKLGKSR